MIDLLKTSKNSRLATSVCIIIFGFLNAFPCLAGPKQQSSNTDNQDHAAQWIARVDENLGASASVAGGVTYGDYLQLLVLNSNHGTCDIGFLIFTMSTLVEEQIVQEISHKSVRFLLNGSEVTRPVQAVKKMSPLSYTGVIILLDAGPISELKERFAKSKIINVEFNIDKKYFDVPKNFWIMKNFGRAVDQAVSLCKKGKDLSTR